MWHKEIQVHEVYIDLKVKSRMGGEIVEVVQRRGWKRVEKRKRREKGFFMNLVFIYIKL